MKHFSMFGSFKTSFSESPLQNTSQGINVSQCNVLEGQNKCACVCFYLQRVVLEELWDKASATELSLEILFLWKSLTLKHTHRVRPVVSLPLRSPPSVLWWWLYTAFTKWGGGGRTDRWLKPQPQREKVQISSSTETALQTAAGAHFFSDGCR